MTFQLSKKENGSINAGFMSVIYQGARDVFASQNAEIALTEAANMSNWGTEGAVRYTAQGIDEKGNQYLVIWDTAEAWDKAMEEKDENILQNESYACEWESPVSILLVEEAEEFNTYMDLNNLS